MQNEKQKLKITLDVGAKVPTRAHEADAGLDVYAATDGVVPSGGSCTLGVIDAGYTGSIVVKLYNHGASPYTVKAGEKISQLVILPIITPDPEVVDSLADTERGTGGFGSTGK